MNRSGDTSSGQRLRGPRGRVREISDRYRLKAIDIAEATATDKRSVRRWAGQSDSRRSRVDEHIRALERVCLMLEDFGLDSRSVGVWLREPNRYLHYATPLTELGAGHFDAVLDAVRSIREGSYGVGILDRHQPPEATGEADSTATSDDDEASADPTNVVPRSRRSKRRT